jgi:hypothetical protein
VPLADRVAYADKWLSLSDPGQLFVVGAAMRTGVPELRSVVAKLDKFLRKRTESL